MEDQLPDFCAECGAYWYCECPGRHEPGRATLRVVRDYETAKYHGLRQDHIQPAFPDNPYFALMQNHFDYEHLDDPVKLDIALDDEARRISQSTIYSFAEIRAALVNMLLSQQTIRQKFLELKEAARELIELFEYIQETPEPQSDDKVFSEPVRKPHPSNIFIKVLDIFRIRSPPQ